MKIIDLHQDLMTHIRFRDQFGQSEQTSFEMIQQSDLDVVVATAFPMPPDDDQYHTSVHSLITEELDMYQEYVGSHEGWSLIEKGSDFRNAGKKLLLHIEGLNTFADSLECWKQMDDWYKLGVRSVATHWNVENTLGGGTLQPEKTLTALGVEMIAYLERKHIIFDMAHMGRASFDDALKIVRRPIYISHGNADSVCSNLRNYTNSQLHSVAKSDGVVGVFFPNTFVVGKGNQGTVKDVIDHFLHMKKMMGVRHIAIGSDFGGIVTGTVDGLDSVDSLGVLWHHLEASGFTSQQIEDVAYNNAHRVITSHLG